MVAEPIKEMTSGRIWVKDTRGDVAILITNKDMRIRRSGTREGFSWVEMQEMTLISCCFSRNANTETMKVQRTDMRNCIRGRGKKVVVVADLNAKSEW